MPNNNTWTCPDCQNVNPLDSNKCLKCDRDKIVLSKDDSFALKCFNKAANDSGWCLERDEADFNNSSCFRTFITTFYQEARKYLLDQIKNQKEEINSLKLQLNNQPPNLKVGDKVWVQSMHYSYRDEFILHDSWEPEQVTVERLESDGFYPTGGFSNIRYFKHFNKTWWLKKP